MELPQVNRRKFIKYSAAVSSSIALSPVLYGPAFAEENLQRELHWYQKPLRILQTVLREPDVESYDAKAVVHYME